MKRIKAVWIAIRSFVVRAAVLVAIDLITWLARATLGEYANTVILAVSGIGLVVFIWSDYKRNREDK